jgi:cell division protein FtsB
MQLLITLILSLFLKEVTKMKGVSAYRELLKRRNEIAREIRELHDSDASIEEIDKRMLELDAEMEDVEQELYILSLG